MKKVTAFIIQAFLFAFTFSNTNAQNAFPDTGSAGIGTITPHASSLLEVNSNSKGVLFPRMTAAQRTAIASPANGLLVYQNDAPAGFYYYNYGWTQLSPISANPSLSNLSETTAINHSLKPKSTASINLGSSASAWRDIYVTGSLYIRGDRILNISGAGNLLVGRQAGLSNTTGVRNSFFGHGAGAANSTGASNTFIGQQAGNKNTEGGGNTFLGQAAGLANTTGNNNTANGREALHANTTGYQNAANGAAALFSNTTGQDNTASGTAALFSNTTGNINTANGAYSLYFNTTGGANTASGHSALNANTTGSDNIADGYNALNSNTTGFRNTSSGAYSLVFNTTGINNAAYGADALFYNSTGTSNTAIGAGALFFNTTGGHNTAVGVAADVISGDLYNATAIGFGSVTNANDKIVIGTVENTNLTGGYGAWQSFSDGRFKENVQGNVPGLTFINKLHPVTYHLNAEKVDEFLGIKQRMDTSKDVTGKAQHMERSKTVSSQLQTGFIAQEVEATAKSIGYDFDGVHHPESDKDNYTIGYSTFVVPLVKAVQELSSANDTKDQQIKTLLTSVSDLQKQIDELRIIVQSLRKGGVNTPGNSVTLSDASLEQNVPNPFNHTTNIGYTLPQKFRAAQITISDKNGKTLKKVNVAGTGTGMLKVDTGTLANGAYNYSLFVDGKLVSTKQMERLR